MENKIEHKKADLALAAIANGMAYNEYESLVSNHVANETNTGPEVTESLVNYTMLNDRRMKRWKKKFKLTPAQLERIQNLERKITWVVLTESWCGDASQTMPMMNSIAEASDKITLKVVLRDEHLAFMDEFLTNGGRSIPKLIAVDEAESEVLNTWGPRPTAATKMVNDYKAKHGALTPEFKQDLQVWYNKDKGQTTTEDLLSLLGV